MNKIKKMYQHSLFPFLCMFLVLFAYHFFIQITSGDEVSYFGKILGNYSLGEFLSTRYHCWTSRLAIEAVLVYVSHWNAWIWKILNIGCIMLIMYSFSYLFDFKSERLKNWVILALILLYPLLDMSTAGWIATTTNYLWPLAFGLYTFTAIKKYKDDIKIKWYEYIFYFLAAVYGANQEQMNVVLLSIYLLFCIYFLVIKKPTIFLWILEVITAAQLIFILTCPGNSIRAASEIGNWMPDFPMFSFIDKAYLGITDTLYVLLSFEKFIVIIFFSVLCFCVFLKTKNFWHRLISVIPIGIMLVHSSFRLYGIIGYSSFLSDPVALIDASNYLNLSSYIPIFIYVVLIGSILLSMLVLYDLTFDLILNTFVLGVGFATRIIMGFSPTLYASNTRTFLYLYMSLVFCTIFMIQRFEDKFTNKNKKVFGICTGIPLVGSVVFVLIYIMIIFD